MHKFVFHNDRILSLREVRLSPGQAGLFNGWGLFTTMRIYAGQPFEFARHWRRLSRDAVRIQLPLEFDPDQVFARLCELVRANQVQEGCARIYFIYNKVGFWCSAEEDLPVVDWLMYTTDLLTHAAAAHLALLAHGRHAASPLIGTKVTAWLNNVWHLEQAHRRGFDEVILLNERGEVTECTSANLFCVRAGQVFTPPPAAGVLSGVTREVLLETGAEAGVPIEERTLLPEDVYAAEEVFVTSTTREVHPVARVEEHRVPQVPGPVTLRLQQAFREYVRQFLAQGARQPAS